MPNSARSLHPARSGRAFFSPQRSGRLSILLLAALIATLPACGPQWIPQDRPASPGAGQQTPDGYYRVRRGDSLYTIAFRYGMDWRDLAAWNGISAPYTIYPDQQLRLSAPPMPTATAAASPSSSAVVVSPAPAPTSSVSRDQPTSAPDQATVSAPRPQPEAGSATETPAADTVATTATDPAAAPPTSPDPAASPAQGGAPQGSTATAVSASGWAWPTDGRILSRFAPNDPSRKGIDIGGTEGQAVVAAAAGQVVYSGSGLIGYGELVIVKHNDRILSAYAHNSKRLVSEGEQVVLGQQLAQMGRNDRNQAMLHFEIRVNGVPTDPLKYLPAR